MKAGELADGAAVLRAKIDMASPNINLRDPALYRIKRATHHNTGDAWCIYPMYTYAHPIEDALENITHSICTLEFEDQRPFYDWLLDTLCRARPAGAAAAAPVRVRAPQRHLRHHQQAQAEGSSSTRRSSTAGTTRACRRSPACAGAATRRQSIRMLCERAGTSKAGGWTDYASLEIALRDDLEGKAPRAMAVLDPVKLELDELGRDLRQRGASRGVHGAGAPASAGARRAPLRARPGGLDRARRLRRGAGEGILPPVSGQPRAPEVRLHRRVHRLRERRRRRRRRGAAPGSSPDTQQRHARRRRGQGQGHHHLGRLRRRPARRSAPLRPAVQRSRSPTPAARTSRPA